MAKNYMEKEEDKVKKVLNNLLDSDSKKKGKAECNPYVRSIGNGIGSNRIY